MLRQALSEFLPSGLPPLDELLGGGWCRGGLTELCGEDGGGKTTLALRAAAALTRKKSLVSLVTRGALIFPPALAGEGLLLRHLLWLRPGTNERCQWSADQVVRSGLFPLVIVSGVRWEERTARRLQLSAEAAGCSVLLLTSSPQAVSWPLLFCGSVRRLSSDRLSIRVLKSRKFLSQLQMEVPLYETENPVDPLPGPARSRIAS